MQKSLFFAVCAAAGSLSAIPASAANAGQAGLPIAALRSIQANADAAGSNAAIYQWRRVNLEVERIIAAEHDLEQSLPAGAAPAPGVALRQAVVDLRSARFSHDAGRTIDAARQVSEQCALLLK